MATPSDPRALLDPQSLLEAYDNQLRAFVPTTLPPGTLVERDGPLVRITGLDPRGFVTYSSLAGVAGQDLDALIARQRDYYAERGEAVEWKLHGHDQPADLPDRLAAAGFLPEEQETVVVGLAAPLADPQPPLPAGVRLREVTRRIDLDRIAEMEGQVWGRDRSFLAQALEQELSADPSGTTVVVAEADVGSGGGSAGDSGDGSGLSTVVCAGWVRYIPGTGFATLWGGSTLPDWRRQGIYRALVSYRAHLAMARGFTYLQVDASADSQPILQRCGFVAVTTTTPYVHPAPASASTPV